MKIALQYIRISDEDQSNFSLSGQQKINFDYAEKHNIQIIKTYIDDGYSAKNFDRPEWKKLEQDLSKNRLKIDYLIVSKYDRLIRNAAEGLAFIEKMEQKWNIKLLSVMENFFIDPHSPFFFKMRADMLVQAEFERRVISDRSQFGVWSAKTQGRYLGVAPFGYMNTRDADDKPIIVVDPEKSKVVKQMFEEFIDDVPTQTILKKAREAGLTLKGHDAFKRIITNHTYGGLILAKSYKENAEKVVKGIHEPIVPEEIFWRAYYKLNGKLKPQPKIIDDNLPVRGVMLCRCCGNPHTGAKSKGRKTYYYYYRCDSCKEYYNAENTHKELKALLNSLSLPEKILQAAKAEYLSKIDKSIKSRKIKTEKVNSEIMELKEKLNSLEEKYITDKIAPETYEKWNSVYKRDLNSRMIEISDLNKSDSEVRGLVERNILRLSDLFYIFDKNTVEMKQAIIRAIFPDIFVKETTGFGTNYIIDIFRPNISKTLGILTIKETGDYGFLPKSPVSTLRNGFIELY